MAEPDDWQKQPAAAPVPEVNDWQPQGQPQPDAEQSTLPYAFLGRLRDGRRLSQQLEQLRQQRGFKPEIAKAVVEGYGQPTPTGFSDENLQWLQSSGIFHDPKRATPSPMQFANEAVGIPLAQAWQAITGTAGAINRGAAATLALAVRKPEDTPEQFEKYKNEIDLFGQLAQVSLGMEPHIFARPQMVGGVARDQLVGQLPRPIDFKNGAAQLEALSPAAMRKVPAVGPAMKSNFPMSPAETNLRAAWETRGVMPAEAVDDAAKDAFIHHDLVSPHAPLVVSAEAGENLKQAGIIAYHGSPYDFTAFSSDKIGTGEGAQSYGYGHYVAENPAVSTEYQKRLSALAPDTIVANAMARVRNNGGSYKNALADIDDRIAKSHMYNDSIASLEQLKQERDVIANEWKPDGGVHYTVRVHADQEKMLDWDQPLSEQTPYVRGALKKFGLKDETDLTNLSAENGTMGPDFNENGPLGPIIRGHSAGMAREELSKALADAGIPGIKYLDQGSRPVNKIGNPIPPQQTRNYVIFNDKDIEITHKNGVPTSNYLHSLGADVTTDPPIDEPLSRTTAAAPGRMSTMAGAALEKLFDIGRDARMLTNPMSAGSNAAQAIAKDFANSLRRSRWDWARIDKNLVDTFSTEQLERMWNAMDEESVLRQEGKTSPHMGIATLEPAERAIVEDMNARGAALWAQMRDIGMVKGEGLPYYAPRMMLNAATAVAGDAPTALNAMGRNLRTRTAQMLKREHLMAEETEEAARAKLGDDAKLARNIRVHPLAMSRLEDAIAGQRMIKEIEDVGRRTGDDTVAIGARPMDSAHTWFTIDHPAFRKWRPMLQWDADGAASVQKTTEGDIVFKQVPIFVRDDFEGPLRAVLDTKSNAVYNAAMDVKGRVMGLIMNSPLIHNAVVWGKVLPSFPLKTMSFKLYFEGNRAKNNVALMQEAIDGGMVPIGSRFGFRQDLNSMLEEPNLSPGRSWTSQIVGAVPGLFDPAAGAATRAAIDKLGNFWHNTLLWDRVGDIQAGVYVNLRDSLLQKGVDRETAVRVAGHFANRLAGSIPREAMSKSATQFMNLTLFSRSYTASNLGIFKDALTGLPGDLRAQIERDSGALNDTAEKFANSFARRKAGAIILTDLALFYAGTSILQNIANVMFNDHTLDQEMHGYAVRLKTAVQKRIDHPLSLLQPIDFVHSLTAQSENEPGHQGQIHVGYDKDGTAIYARNPAGKFAEEMLSYMTGPLDMMRRKQGTFLRPGLQILENDKGFGRKIYDPDAKTTLDQMANMGRIAEHFMEAQLPENQLGALASLIKGEGDPKVNSLQAFGPLAGATFSKGAPGGPAVGEMYAARQRHDFQVQLELPDIRKLIQGGQLAEARERMTNLGIPPGLQKFYIRTTLNPSTRLGGRTLKDFYQYATPEERERLEGSRP